LGSVYNRPFGGKKGGKDELSIGWEKLVVMNLAPEEDLLRRGK